MKITFSFITVVILTAVLVFPSTARSEIPLELSYSGFLRVEEVPFEGLGEFKFALTNKIGIESFWSNDGSSRAGSEPSGAVTLDVTNGVFFVKLGDENAGMEPLTARIFDYDDEIYLKVWFSDGVNGFEALEPMVKLTSAPFAITAQTLQGLTPDDFLRRGDSIPSDRVAAFGDNGTSLTMGRNQGETVTIYAATREGAEKPALRYNSGTSSWQYSNNGATWSNIGSLSGAVTQVSASLPFASSGGTTPNISLAGAIPVASGGTGATTAAEARTNLGLANAATTSAVSTNTASTAVLRDESGNFSAGTITANLTGNVTGNADINGGTVDNAVIGGETPAAATVTTFTAKTSAKIEDPGDGTNTVTLRSPTLSLGSYTLTMPLSAGSGGQHLITDGTGALSWATPGSGSVNTGVAGYFSYYPSSSTTVDDQTVLYTDGTRLGVGATNPAVALDVNGDIQVRAQSDVRFADSDSSNFVAFQAPATVTDNVTWTLPAVDGLGSQALTTNGAGILSWATPAGTGANTAMSNLASVAINTSLVSDADNTDDLGSDSVGWKNVYARAVKLDGSTSGTTTLQSSAIAGTTALTLPAATDTLVGRNTADTLTNKTLTSPVIGTSPTAAGATWADLGTVTTADINGGTIDGAVIGGASQAAATVTTLTAKTSAVIEDPGAGTNTVTLQSPAALSASYALTLPADDGTASQVLTTDGAGALSWSTPASDAVSSVFGRTGAVTAATNDYTWAQINKATSSLADIATRSHTALTDIGTNTHAQIDTHVAATGSSVHGLGTLSTQASNNVAITGGAIDGTTIGASTPAAAAVTTLTAKTGAVLEDPGVGISAVTIQSPAALVADYVLTLPADDGTANQVIATDGSGNLSWTSPSTGDMTAVGSMTSGDAFADSSADDDWLGLGSGAGRIEFDDQTTDEVNILGANVGIGTASPASKLEISRTGDGSGYALNTGNTLASGTGGTPTAIGINSGVLTNDNNANQTLVGIKGGAWFGSGRNATSLIGLQAVAQNDAGTSTVTNLKMVDIPNMTAIPADSTVTNTYGLYVGDITSATGTQTNTPYSIYASDAGAYSYVAGNVGIGTTSPGSALDVKGTLRLSGSTSGYVGLAPAAAAGSTTYTLPSADGSSGQVLSTSGSGVLSWATPASGDMTSFGSMTSGDAFSGTSADDDWLGLGSGAGRVEFDDQTTDEVNILGANVGIGTQAPSNLLHVKGTTGVLVNIDKSGGATDQAADLQLSPNGNTWLLQALGSGVAGLANAFRIYDSTQSASRFVIDSAGSVGINTTGPDRRLDIMDASNPQLRLSYTDGSVYNDLQTDSSGFLNLSNGTSTHTIFIVNSTVGGKEAQIAALNTGTAANSTARILARAEAGAGADSDPVMDLMVNGGDRYSVGIDNSDSDKFGIWKYHTPGTNPRLIVDSSGNVGVGTATPQALLDVGGYYSHTDVKARAVVTGAKGSFAGIPTYQLTVRDSTSMAAGVGGAIAFDGNYTGTSTSFQ